MVHVTITLLASLALSCHSLSLHQQVSHLQLGNSDWEPAIRAVQSDCDEPSENISFGFGGGFASMFQVAAWRATAALKAKKKPIQLLGHFGSYSDNDICKKHVGDETYNSTGTFTCFFAPLRTCAHQSLATGQTQTNKKREEANAMLDRTDVEKNCSLFFAVEKYLFRPNKNTLDRFKEMIKALGVPIVRGSPRQGNILIGVHIRRGDKMSDEYNKYINITNYVQAIRGWAEQTDFKHKKCSVYVASDCNKSFGAVHRMLDGKTYGNCLFEVHGSANTTTQKESRNETSIKDQLNQVANLTQWNLMNDILFDIYVLSQADVLVGTLSSQIGRMAAGMRSAKDPFAWPPIALDFSAKPFVETATKVGGFPVCDLEGWVAPPVDLQGEKDDGGNGKE